MFQEYLEQLISSDSSSATDSEPATREMGTDPMMEANPSTQPPNIQTTKLLSSISTSQLNQFLNQPIIIIHQSGNKPVINSASTPVNFVSMDEYPAIQTEGIASTEIFDTMTPSPSNDSSDEQNSSSPDAALEANQGNMVTDLTVRVRPLLLGSVELDCLGSSESGLARLDQRRIETNQTGRPFTSDQTPLEQIGRENVEAHST